MSDEVLASPDERATPRRRRFVGLWRGLKVAGVALLVLLALRLVWGYRVNRQIEARLAEYRARGEPWEARQFEGPAIPDDQNAAVALRRAAAKIVDPPAESYVEGLTLTDPGTPAQQEVARKWVSDNREALGLAEAALKLDRVNWTTDGAHDDPMAALQEIGPAMSVAYLLLTASTVEFRQGDWARALEHAAQVLKVSRTMIDEPWWFLQHQRHRLESRAAEQIEGIVSPSVSGPPGTPAEVRQIIARLLDEAPDREAIVRCLYAERARAAEIYRSIAEGHFDKSFFRYRWAAPGPLGRFGLCCIAPYIHRREVTEMDYYTALIPAVREPDARSMSARLPAAPPLNAPPRWTGFYGADALDQWLGSGSNLNQGLGTVYFALADRRRAALLLAARLYQSEHGGQPPTEDHQLVPNYIDHFPGDPIGGGTTLPLRRGVVPASRPASRPSTNQ
ncbi:MAG TPA: hypothetical protein VH475_21165 [Tepidisphaeraceae bacterium]